MHYVVHFEWTLLFALTDSYKCESKLWRRISWLLGFNERIHTFICSRVLKTDFDIFVWTILISMQFSWSEFSVWRRELINWVFFFNYLTNDWFLWFFCIFSTGRKTAINSPITSASTRSTKNSQNARRCRNYKSQTCSQPRAPIGGSGCIAADTICHTNEAIASE